MVVNNERAKMLNNEILERSLKNSETDDGLISIINGVISVSNPKTKRGQKAQIVPSNVKIWVNNIPISGPLSVDSLDEITFTLPDPRPQTYQKRLSFDKYNLEATLTVTNKRGNINYFFRDQAPSDKLILAAVPHESPFDFNDTIENEILSFLRDQGIVYGIDPFKIRAAFTDNSDIAIVVAKGLPPVPTTHDQLIYHYDIQKHDLDLNNLQTTDYSNKKTLIIVSYGDLLLTRGVGKKGTPGMDIMGREIPVLDPIKKKFVPVMDGSVSVNIDETEVKAGISGIPSFDGTNIKVKPVYIVEGDADVNEVGNIDFPGTVIIEGSTLDNIHIWANQNIEVKKDTIHSFLDAEESIKVDGKVIKGKLIAGGEAAACVKVIPYIQNITNIMIKILRACSELFKSAPHLVNFPEDKIILELIRTLFPSLPQECDELWQIMDTLKRLNYKNMLTIKSVLANILNIQQRKFNKTDFAGWIQQLNEVLDKLKRFESVAFDIYTSYAQLANIATSGTIFITREGCYNSHLLSGGNIIINGNPGYFREGTIKAKGIVYVKELGCPNGTKTIVEVSEKGKIISNHVYSGVSIKIGEAEHHFLDDFYNLEATLDEDGETIKLTKVTK